MDDIINQVRLDVKSLEWTAPEFEEFDKSPSWYWLSLLFAIVIVFFAVWQGNFLFGIFAALAEIMILYWASKKPREIHFRLTDDGLEIDSKFYPLEGFTAFAIWDSEIIFQRKTKMGTHLKIYSHLKDLERARGFLEQRLSAFDYEPSLMDNIARILRF